MEPNLPEPPEGSFASDNAAGVSPEVLDALAAANRGAALAYGDDPWTRRMEALLSAGPFELHPPPGGCDEDRYGRKLRIVTRGGRSLGDVLVEEGLARTWTGRRLPWC